MDRCIAKLFSITADEIEQLNREHRVLRQRIEQFLLFDDYHSLTPPDLSEPFDAMLYLSAGLRLELLNAIALNNESKPERAVERLLALLMRVRKQLEMQDTLIGKMLMASVLADTIDVLNVVAARSTMNNLQLAPLTDKEKDMSRVVAREFASQFRLLQQLDRNPQFFNEGESMPGWYTRVFFKPNITANALAPRFLRVAELSRLSYAEFVRAVSTAEEPVSTSWIRNSIGNILLQMNQNLEQYTARLFDLDIKIVLFNNRTNSVKQLENPYYPHRYPIITNDKVCFDGPMEDPREFRCLKFQNN
jgi:hypothetical protein